MHKNVVIFGCGEAAEVVDFYFERDVGLKVSGFVVDDDYLRVDTFCKKKVVGMSEANSVFDVGQNVAFVAVGYSNLNQLRAAKCSALKHLGYKLTTLISTKALVADNVIIGENCLILEHNTVQPFSSVGNNTFLWSGNHVGHHSRVGANVFISSHCVISGEVKIGDNSFLGVNSTITDHVTVGSSVVVGAGALIVSDVADGEVVLAPKSRISTLKSHQLPPF